MKDSNREAFEKLPEIKKRLDMKCVHFNGTWYATNPHMGNSFATASYLNGAWMAWQAAKAQAVPEGFILVPKDTLNKALNPNDYDEAVCSANELLAAIEAQEPSSSSGCPDEP